MKVEIKNHERTCMLNTVIIMRALAKTLSSDPNHAQNLRVWAQGIEDVVERMEADMLIPGCQKGRLKNDGA